MTLKSENLGTAYRTIRYISDLLQLFSFNYRLEPHRLVVGNSEAEDLINTDLVSFEGGKACFTSIPLVLSDEPKLLVVEDVKGSNATYVCDHYEIELLC